MSRTRTALIIGTATATSQTESGASLRLYSIGQLLEMAGFEVRYASPSDAKARLTTEWDVIAVVSFSSAKFLKRARRKTKFLWFDPTDSWSLSRISLLRAGDLKQAPALIRDLFHIWTSPKLDLITFITRRDALSVTSWLSNQCKYFVIPNSKLERNVENSNAPRLVFMGDGKYVPNQKALEFLQSSFAESKLLGNLHIYGDGFTTMSKGGIFHGYVEGKTHLKSGDIHLAPIFYGAGMKMKVALPLVNGLKVITTEEGATGLKNQFNLKIAKTSVEFEEIAQELVNQPVVRHKTPTPSEIYADDESSTVLGLLKEKFSE